VHTRELRSSAVNVEFNLNVGGGGKDSEEGVAAREGGEKQERQRERESCALGCWPRNQLAVIRRAVNRRVLIIERLAGAIKERDESERFRELPSGFCRIIDRSERDHRTCPRKMIDR